MMATRIGRWTAKGLTHSVFRVSSNSPYYTMCEIELSPKSHRAVRSEGTITCIPCMVHDRFKPTQMRARKRAGLCVSCGTSDTRSALCKPCKLTERT